MSTKTVFETLAAEINALRGSPVVAIDGVDGSGKTTFTKSLAAQLNERPAIVIHVDDFLNPPEIRHRRGRLSPEGFWLDSYDYDANAELGTRHIQVALRKLRRFARQGAADELVERGGIHHTAGRGT